MTARPLLIEGRPVTDAAVAHCPEHGHEATVVNDPTFGWLLDGRTPTDADEAGLIFECPGVLGAGSRDTEPCECLVVLDFAPASDKTASTTN